MRHTAEYVFSIGSVLICAAMTIPSVTASRAMPIESVTDQISSYKKWARVNPEPLQLPAALNTLCAAPSAATKDPAYSSSNPHRQKFFTVYVNDIGERAMLNELTPRFPAGSIVVKEKLPSRESREPELLTAMIKRERGFNPQSGDWEFLVLDGSGKKIEARGKLETCQSCHAMKKNSDFVFRSYLTEETRRELR
ncbi:MAG TPA: cytochrome P460 family protein [Blastocatellia bacterium]|jgi:hypothetical protein